MKKERGGEGEILTGRRFASGAAMTACIVMLVVKRSLRSMYIVKMRMC